MQNQSIPKLLPLLKAVLQNSIEERQTNELVSLAYQFAIIRLKQLMHHGKLHLHSFNLPLDGIAVDCIADLFQRDIDGRFIDFCEFFSNEYSADTLDEASATHLFRSLIFTKLQDGIFRLYRENDPVLARIIRNIKSALPKIPEIIVYKRLGQTYLSSCSEKENNLQLPEIEIEWLENELYKEHVSLENTHKTVRSAMEISNRQTTYRKCISLIDLAIVLKRILVVPSIDEASQTSPEQLLFAEEIARSLQTAFDASVNNLRIKYLESGKINADLFLSYCSALEMIMKDVFLRNDGQDKAHHEYLKEIITGLTYEDYRKTHRTYFEYMVRTTKNAIKERLKELL